MSTTYKVKKGDAIDMFGNFKGNTILMHGANCHKVMGAGFAKQIVERIPPLYFLDVFDNRTPPERFGSMSVAVLIKSKEFMKIGVNLYTQFLPGSNFDITALRNSLRAFNYSIPEKEKSSFTIFIPKIGSGIGGGDWNKIEPVIKKELSAFNVVVVDYQKEIKKEPNLTKV